jgi:inner membrane protein
MVYLALWHRGITHSLVLLPLWVLFVGVMPTFVCRQFREWRYLTLRAGIAVVSHTASALITVYGTQILALQSTWRASLGTTFIIAPWFTLIVLGGFIAGLSNTSDRLPRASRAVLLGYLLFQGGLKRQALSIGRDHAS